MRKSSLDQVTAMTDLPPPFASIFSQKAKSKRAPGQVFGNNRLVGPRGEGSGIALYWDIECMHCGKVRAIRKDAISNLRKQNGCGCLQRRGKKVVKC